MLNGHVKTTACQAVLRISKATVLALMANTEDEGTPNNPLNPAAATFRPYLLKTIPLAHWDVMSFNPAKREVCVLLYVFDKYGQRTGASRVLSITLPVLAYNPHF